MGSLYYLAAAYALIWGLIFVYTLVLGRRQAGLEAELELLQRLMARKEGEA